MHPWRSALPPRACRTPLYAHRVRLQLQYTGRVQGVGFRATAEYLADTHNQEHPTRPVAGWVRNQPDGSVLLEVQGTPDAIDVYLDRLHTLLANNIHATDRLAVPDCPQEHTFTIRG